MRAFLLVSLLFISCTCFAQQPIVTFINTIGQKTDNRDSALLIRTITGPDPGSTLYNFTEDFVTGEPLRTGKTLKTNEIFLDGKCTVYYPSGKKLSEIIYENGLEKEGTFYFANGKIFKVSHFTHSIPNLARPEAHAFQESILTCNDSTGKALISNGKGYFIGYSPVISDRFWQNVTSLIYFNWLYNDFEEGEMKNGLRDGIWKGKGKHDGIQYTEIYKKGKLINGESVDSAGTHYKYQSNTHQDPMFPGGLQAFANFLKKNIQYPESARANYFDKIYATFAIDKDGSITDIRMFQSPNDDLSAEIIRVLKQCPLWTPGSYRGMIIKEGLSVPIIPGYLFR